MDIGLISLGCSKNQVDSEIMLAILKKSGHKIVGSTNLADLIIINTCGFITDAKEEAIDTIIEVGELKKQGVIHYIIATGCLAQRYGRELMQEMPELDAVVGIADYQSIKDVVEQVSSGEKIVLVNHPPTEFIEKGPRILTTPKGSAYLRITEGCNNKCAYCAIPAIRGRLRSASLDEVLEEAYNLASQGVKELVLIGQDTASYGKDLGYKNGLSELLTKLDEITELEWIRIMYVHPAHLTEDIIEVIANQTKVVPYLDLPIQHTTDNILKSMHRKHDEKHLSSLILKLRNNIKDLVLRTTVMLGFPGETADDFNRLYQFIEEKQFDWLGAFRYSLEENTPAYNFKNQIEEGIKEDRLNRVLTLQNQITRQKNIARIGSKQKILISSKVDHNLYIGRGYFQAPEVDGITMVKTNEGINKGEFVDVVLKAVRDYDMIGEHYNESP
ncbi:MAG TPA: 30S ribosomal protein S12 methylthiotransferase RimO [Syntrophomonadaceae bacterium]|nr:30S ribosomal protein S12 methylthiotransferase RimO [Syntrophomonadaceae bacterium]